jgi:hypothetical protein
MARTTFSDLAPNVRETVYPDGSRMIEVGIAGAHVFACGFTPGEGWTLGHLVTPEEWTPADLARFGAALSFVAAYIARVPEAK